MESAASRAALTLQHVRDPNSDYYKGLCAMLRNATAMANVVAASKSRVELPFKVDERDEVALETQFKVAVKSKGSNLRARLTPRVAGMVSCVDETLLEHAGGPAKRLMLVDGDAVTLAVRGIEGRVVERTGATARLTAGYALERTMLEQLAAAGDKPVNTRARVVLREVAEGGGEHFSPRVGESGVPVDAIVVNHFRTPAGPHQLAWLGLKRAAVVYGAFPFQVDMLVHDEGELACFPGRYYVDRKLDVVTLVPSTDASMSVSHPYSALVALATNLSVTVAGQEFLLERYMAAPGIMYYTIKHIDADFEAPESLRSYYFSPSEADVTVLKYPTIELSSDGVPVRWGRGEVRILTSRYNKVLARVMCSASAVVRPAEVYVALMDHNNLVINTMDTAVVADRMATDDEDAAALAIALHVNFRRHAMRGTLNVLVDAVKRRYEVADAKLGKLLWMAMVAWLNKPVVTNVGEVTDVACVELLDWCGNDFGVYTEEVDPWFEVEQVAGLKATGGGWFADHLPVPPRGADVSAAGVVTRLTRDTVSTKTRTGLHVPRAGIVAAVVDSTVAEVKLVGAELSEVKAALREKMVAEQGATVEVPAGLQLRGYAPITSDGVGPCPVPDVEPISAIQADLVIANGGLPQRDAVVTGYRLAEVDVVKETRGNISINDAKRVIPKPTHVRRPRVDAGVEGTRVASQQSLLGAVFKRNIGVPNNRGLVDLDRLPELTVDKLIATCFRDDWERVVEKHLNTGMWEPGVEDIDDFLRGCDESKAKAMLEEFFLEGEVRLDRWLLMAKGKVKPSRDQSAQSKVDHAQTILFLENKSTNAMYSSMTRRFKKCLDECLRPEVSLNAQDSPEEHEEWYNSLEGGRRSFPRTYAYASDMRCYDRGQEHPGMLSEMALYRRMGLNKERYDRWCETHGPKKALSMAFGVIFTMVWGGISGIWKTLLRNGLINLMAVVVCCSLGYRDIVMLDIKGDDMDAEFSRMVDVESTAQLMGSMYNLSAKFYTADVRYMCKEFRIRVNGRWYFVADPWARVQSLCSPLRVDGAKDALVERWKSLVADLRHYDNGILIDKAVEAAQVFYGVPGCFYGMARALAMIRADKKVYCNFFSPPERIM